MSTLTAQKYWSNRDATVYMTVTYSVSSTNDTTTVTFTKIETYATGSPVDVSDVPVTIKVDGASVYSGKASIPTNSSSPASRKGTLNINASKAISRGHSASSKSIVIQYSSDFYGTDSKSTTFSVPARPSYAVSYDANGHGTAPGGQTKWYGESLSLQPAMTAAGWLFTGWNTASDGSGTAYSAGASYTGNSALSLYAQWKRNIDSVTIGDAKAIRTDTLLSTSEADEGTCAYLTVPFTVKGAAAADVEMTVTMEDADGNSVTVTRGTYQATKQESEADLTGTFTARAGAAAPNSGTLATDSTYTFHVTVTASNTSETQADVDDELDVVLSTAYYTMDVLGDGYLYVLTSDAAVDSRKTYYTRSGSGTENDPYVYTEVSNPSDASIGSYYESHRPGHGVSFGAPAKHEGFNVSMQQYSFERACYPIFVYSAFPTDANDAKDESQLPITPCFVHDTSDGAFYFCDGQ